MEWRAEVGRCRFVSRLRHAMERHARERGGASASGRDKGRAGRDGRAAAVGVTVKCHQRESDGVQYVVVATRAMRVWRPPATRDASALGAHVEDQRFAGVVMGVPRTMTEAAAAVSP